MPGLIINAYSQVTGLLLRKNSFGSQGPLFQICKGSQANLKGSLHHPCKKKPKTYIVQMAFVHKHKDIFKTVNGCFSGESEIRHGKKKGGQLQGKLLSQCSRRQR